jgi:type IX secretion system PorP/SprF family membrane protein
MEKFVLYTFNIVRATLVLVFSIVTINAVSQEIHFSQFYANPLSINPANTAWYDGNLRVNAMYRTQWRAIDAKPFQTVSFGLEKQFQFYDFSYGIGVCAIRDESGYVGLINDKILFSGAFAANVNGHNLSGGIQAGLVYKTTNIAHYTYNSQFDLGGESVFNRNFENGEQEDGRLFHLAINAGVLWDKQLTSDFIAKAGISIFNINTPYESFYGVELKDSEQALRVAIQGGGKYTVNKKITVQPNLLFMRQEKATELLIGGNVDYAFKKDVIVYGGTIFRYGFSKNYDATVWIIGTKYKRFNIGASYDINVSSLREATNYRGAVEVSLTYLTPSWKSTKVKIPCERF